MKKFLLKIILGLFLAGMVIGFGTPALALETPGVVESALGNLPDVLSPEHRIANIVNWLLGIAATISVLLIVISGIRYITSAGNQQEIDDAKRAEKVRKIGWYVYNGRLNHPICFAYSIVAVGQKVKEWKIWKTMVYPYKELEYVTLNR